MLLKPPTSPLETFQLLTLYDSKRGLDALLDRVAWRLTSPRQIYHAVLGRVPESSAVAIPGPKYSPRRHARNALQGAEFQRRIIRLALNAFPEKKRLLFVHVPKCAGTDLIRHLSDVHPWLDEQMAKRNWTPSETLLGHLRDFSLAAGQSNSLFVSGHIRLNWYLTSGAYRYGDRLLTTVRDPRDIAVSMTNYVLRRFVEMPSCKDPDTQEWANILGIEDGFDVTMGDEEMFALALRILVEPRIVVPNILCAYLGKGTTESALDMMACCDVEMTDLARYNKWLKSEWGIESATRRNASPGVISWHDVPLSQQEAFAKISGEDFNLYDRIVERLDKKGDYRVFGPELI